MSFAQEAIHLVVHVQILRTISSHSQQLRSRKNRLYFCFVVTIISSCACEETTVIWLMI